MSYRPKSYIQLLRFELSGGCLIYINIISNQKDGQSNPFLDSIEAPKRSEYGTQIPIDMSKAGPITPIPNPK